MEPRQAELSLGERLLLNALRMGPMPEHVALIMDGNRRFAKNMHQPVEAGHLSGFETMKHILYRCFYLGIRTVSVYAFSLENFKRPASEVDALMDLAQTHLKTLCEHGDLAEQANARLRIIGRREMLPASVQTACASAEGLTSEYTESLINCHCPYTSRDEMLAAMLRVLELGLADSCTVDLLESKMYTHTEGRPMHVDILIRTSGVTRLSDYLLWQANEDTWVHFIERNWPELSMWDLVPVLAAWQAASLWKAWVRGEKHSDRDGVRKTT